MGYCPRRLGYDKLGCKGDVLTPRRLSIFDDGNFYDQRLKADILVAMGHRAAEFTGPPISMEIEGVEVTGNPDMYFEVEE